MELIAAYIACALLGLAGVRLGVPEAYHTVMDYRHAACLRRTAVLEIELGLREPPALPAARFRVSPASAAERWTAGVQSAGPVHLYHRTPEASTKYQQGKLKCLRGYPCGGSCQKVCAFAREDFPPKASKPRRK